jgi:hypothetical protein
MVQVLQYSEFGGKLQRQCRRAWGTGSVRCSSQGPPPGQHRHHRVSASHSEDVWISYWS